MEGESEDIKKLLDEEVKKRDNFFEISYENPDPILVARRYKDEKISLICSLFAYGKASLIVRFLDSLDFSLLESSEEKIKKSLKNSYYRFQSPDDIANIFITLKRVASEDSLENIFLKGYKKEQSCVDGLVSLISALEKVNRYDSYGYRFLIGKAPLKISGSSALKRWNMYLRWMVREDNIDFGLWKRVEKKDLIIPLDTHTFKVSGKLGLLKRKSCDLKAAIELTEKLKEFDKNDPVKYDFALYRIGQEKKI
ncbi:TIGR02757 family protein [Nitrosophilus alvini]|uniref:TIGR02757 family protein n=1 Tax=Nitrosophilus alvini TaxID=2714855 RepID=UPI00190DCB35|nr:TIGR02757 family protein [Nitrosophilus alvini]